ncbi:MAG: large conductance mechanosensitive channel protein MscL [Propionicimonas sp.]|uniref:large conductance mechanosensitive channel protein MscL n=1 Tax=Propionicimonas sp. TaxID=1955623 RepID=UPI002B212A1B|nr:large conductance mechanosensitive channel protein MscL [Propionicimonas sp.]MEA4945787.1 large conductance mechanosensitive channel protein MscL [Propionicimonas sp.]MEA5054373.1 large conductance mechanosensitive channel protein MscL [Propionicimonas sp.]
MKGFKDFLMRGNLIDLAVAVIIGGAFGAVVTTFTDVILSIISLFGGNPNFDSVAIGGVVVGPFITALVSFLIIAAIVYFLIIKPIEAIKAGSDKLAGKAPEPEAEAAPTTEDLLTEIRDLLKEQAK